MCKRFYTLDYENCLMGHFDTEEELKEHLKECLKDTLNKFQVSIDDGGSWPPINLDIDICFKEEK